MKQTVKIYAGFFVLYFRQLRAFRFDWILSLIKVPVLMVLYWFVWRTLFQSSPSAFQGYTFEGMIVYLLTVQWIAFVVSYGVADKISEDIQSGQLLVFLARPVHYLPALFGTYFGHVFFSLLTTLPLLILAKGILSSGDTFSSVQQWLNFLPFLLGAIVISFLLEACIGLASFWLQRIFGLRYLILTILNIAGGKLIPLSLFPDWFQNISILSPLRLVYYEPARILTSEGMGPWALQGIWLFVLTMILALIWNRGKLSFEASG
jgi:ABC-2 type transport system permease protein